MAYMMFAGQDNAIEYAIEQADRNGAPVAVLTRDRWFRIEEDADEMDRLITDEGWEQVAVLDPTETAVR